MVEPLDAHVQTLLNMGFVDDNQIRRALVLAKNDLNDAVALLTGDDAGSSFELFNEDTEMRDTETQHGSDDGGMDIPPLLGSDEKDGGNIYESSTGEPPPSYNEAVSGHALESIECTALEFPTTNLYELEDRVFVESWSIPYKREESLGRCLISAARFADEGSAEADENCRRFIDRALPECFKKLLTSPAVNRWAAEIHEGIYDMLELLIDLQVARLKHKPIHYGLLFVLTQALDPETEFHLKNRNRQWERIHWENKFGSDQCYAVSPSFASYKEPHGWLVNLLNRFAEKGGFEEVKKQVETTEKLDAPMLAALLQPFGVCADYLNHKVIIAAFGDVMEKTVAYIQELKEEDMKQKEVGKVYELLTTLKLLCLRLTPWQKDVPGIDELRLDVVLKMLKSPHFNAKMNALKEVCRLMEDCEKNKPSKITISQDTIVSWLVDNKVLSIAFENNLHQSQYCDRLRTLVEFLGTRLLNEELTTIWKMQDGKHPTIMDNIHNILATAAVKFNSSQLDHLFVLIQQSWAAETDRTREKLLFLIGKIGKESRMGKIAAKVLDLLWSLSHLPSLPNEMVEQALQSHIEILSDSYTVKEPVKRTYAIRCVEDIKKGVWVVPAIRQLLKITKGMVRQTFSKQDKGILHELQKNFDIIKLTVNSLVRCHQLAETVAAEHGLDPDTKPEEHYTHQECVNVHLKFLAFVLRDAALYLHWHRARDIWDILSASSCYDDREVCFDWFTKGLCDLEQETQQQMFTGKVLKLEPSKLTMKGFMCFKAFFESVNSHEHKLKNNNQMVIVEKPDLIGMDYLWRIVLEASDEEIATSAIKVLMQLTYTHLSPKLKKDPVIIHKKFILECYKRLEAVMTALGHPPVRIGPAPSSSPTIADIPPLSPPQKAAYLLCIERILLLAEHYIVTVEDHHSGPRTFLPHGASFYGYPVVITVSSELPRQEFTLNCHSNESLFSVRQRIANRLNTSTENVQIIANDKLLISNKDQKLLYQLGFGEEQVLIIKSSVSSVTTVPTKEEAETQDAMKIEETLPVHETPRQSFALEQERMMPGVIMATECKAFDKLYQLASLEEPSITAQVRSLLMLIPTDPAVQEIFETIALHQFTLSCSPGTITDTTGATGAIENLFKCSASGMSPYRVMYSLEVLSSRLMPTRDRDGGASAKVFKDNFLSMAGLNIVINILQKETFPPDVDPEIRHSCYSICLQLARFLLCGQSSDNSSFLVPNTPPKREAATVGASPIAMATGTIPTSSGTVPMATGTDNDTTDSYHINSAVEAKRPRSSSVLEDADPLVRAAIETMDRDDFAETIACLMRVAWAAAAGRLHLASAIGRSKSSQSDDECGYNSDTDSIKSLRGGVCVIQDEVSNKDAVVAGEALELLVMCLQLRTQLLGVFYYLPNVNDFIIDILIGSPHSQVRAMALEQLYILSQISIGDPKVQTPHHILLNMLLHAHLPLWTPTVHVRGSSLKLQRQCSQYFDLLCRLLEHLTLTEQKIMKVDPTKMIQDDVDWLMNVELGSNGESANALLTGHLKLMKTLFTCEGVDKRTLGKELLRNILDDFLFPASKLIFDTRQAPRDIIVDVNPKCNSKDSRVAAYDLLVALSEGCADNLFDVVSQLISMHHTVDPTIAQEWEFQPLVQGHSSSGYVGIRNGGATCYMNSIIQQLFLHPGIKEAVLSVDTSETDRESVFYQIQNVFSHLLESKLQFYSPDTFWKCFKLWGMPVNIREQQDAFEFFCNLIDQLDEYLKSIGQDEIFKKTFCGMFSDQKNCKECRHRYEREEAFYSLQVTVKSQTLENSLEQFVNGELLEGDNAYFCEKCNERRTTTKRLCIKTLPPVLVIQLKRFGYDWEAGRALKFDDYFEFPWVLNMEPYTVEGMARRENLLQSESDSDNGSQESMVVSPPSSPRENNYELVGVVVHSGQANAGHYYSFIKERSGNGERSGKWFKFNDISVDEFELNEETIEAECFGGTYKAKVYDQVNSSYPETRHRYWNGYLLLYESMDKNSPSNDNNTLRPSLSRQDAVTEHRSMPPSPSSTSSSSSGPSSPRGDGLSQLTALVQKGEKRGLFQDRVHSGIQRVVHEENLQFMQNRDVYSVDYFKFIRQLASCNISNLSDKKSVLMAVCSLQLGVQFLFNTYFRTTQKLRCDLDDWCTCVGALVQSNTEACTWFITFLAGDRGKGYLKPFLLECPVREVRFAFVKILVQTCQSCLQQGSMQESLSMDALLNNLLSMLERDVVDYCKNCAEIFWLFNRYSDMGHKACAHLINRNGFTQMLSFLVGPLPPLERSDNTAGYDGNHTSRRWSSLQCQEFLSLHIVLASLIINCDVSKQMTVEPTSQRPYSSSMHNLNSLIPIPAEMEAAVFGSYGNRYIREAMYALCEISGTNSFITDMFIHCSWCNENYSLNILATIKLHLASVAVNEMKHLFKTLIELLMMEDPLQLSRMKAAIEGNNDGILVIIKKSNQADSRRAYQCIKFLVTLAQKCSTAKDYLLQNSTNWQWAVNWLRRKMNEQYWTQPAVSNESTTSKSFQRTVSAQDTLAEATALLTELEAKDGIENIPEQAGVEMVLSEDWDKDLNS